MSIYLRIIDTSAITPLVTRLAQQQAPWFSLEELLRAWFTYHLWDLQTVLVGSTRDLEFAQTLPKEFLQGDDFAIRRLYAISQLELAPHKNRCFHDRAELRVMPASLILVYKQTGDQRHVEHAFTSR